MGREMENKAAETAAQQFAFDGEIIGGGIYGSGHINDTYRLTCRLADGTERFYILQRMNKDIFKNPVELMENVVGVTSFLRKKIRPDQRSALDGRWIPASVQTLRRRIPDLAQDRTGSCRTYRGTVPVSDARTEPTGSKDQRGPSEKSTLTFVQNRDFFSVFIRSKISRCNIGFHSFQTHSVHLRMIENKFFEP